MGDSRNIRVCRDCPFCDPDDECRCHSEDEEVIPPEAGGDIEVDDYLGNSVTIS
jgi:hypothetical protein